MRLVETTLLVLAAVLLAVATVYDVGRSMSINHRLVADLRTWRHYTGHDYHNISIDQQTFGLDTQREVLCGNTSPGPPEARTQMCLAIWGPVVNGRRSVHGGWYLPPRSVDLPANRYGCFGPGRSGYAAGDERRSPNPRPPASRPARQAARVGGRWPR